MTFTYRQRDPSNLHGAMIVKSAQTAAEAVNGVREAHVPEQFVGYLQERRGRAAAQHIIDGTIAQNKSEAVATLQTLESKGWEDISIERQGADEFFIHAKDQAGDISVRVANKWSSTDVFGRAFRPVDVFCSHTFKGYRDIGGGSRQIDDVAAIPPAKI